ncbi:AAA family ATPase [Larkinella punicea]|uniref:Chromosome segregation protein SMC n=1 Tax=Larkinella punicea TaxID=2315727 RepID=A0A368JQL8_9BACT|nr:AAA family ATPase [Larkinella punicea]RCR69605.1 chromosome segregation protein SMC [Larkinella punicea]
MKIKRLVIENFKSIERIELIEPNPFTVFVGPNGSGKSNIFEALEFANAIAKNDPFSTVRLFGGPQSVINQKTLGRNFNLNVEFDISILPEYHVRLFYSEDYTHVRGSSSGMPNELVKDAFFEKDANADLIYKQFHFNFSRLFVRNINLQKFPYQDNESLSLSADNLEKVLKRILEVETLKEEIDDWLSLFIPGFESITIHSDTISGNDSLLLKDKHIDKPFNKSLISDGTYNIIALLTAIYQSNEPQFLCIEEPENGLNPKVVRELVNLCRYACEEKGHFIWLNTHSQTLVSKLEPKELILVDKKKGSTQVKQFTGESFYGLRMDEAWLTNALGGGLPW